MSAAPEIDYDYDPEFFSTDDLRDSSFTDNQDAQSPSPEFVEEEKETARAKKYRLKVRHGINFLITGMVQSPATAPDAAALIYHGPNVSAAIGQLADYDDKVRKMIDFITDDTIDNPYILTAVTLLPLAVQLMRNHESVVEQLPNKFRLRIPFTKRTIKLPVKFKFSLKWSRNISFEPKYLTFNVLGHPGVQENLRKRGINIAWPVNAESNGHVP